MAGRPIPALATLAMAAIAATASSEPPAYEESVEISAPPIYCVEKHFVVRGPEGSAWSDVDASWLSFSMERAPLLPTIQVRPFTGPAALTIIIDTSGSMFVAKDEQVALASELLGRMHPGDRVRLIAFSDDLRFTRWAEAVTLRAELVRQHLHALQRERLAGAPDCLRTGVPGAGGAAAAALEAWMAACSLEEQRSIERDSMASFARRLVARTGATVPGPALEEAVSGMLPDESLDFLPGFEATLGLVVMSDGGFAHSAKPWSEAVLDTLLVQRWYFASPGSRVGIAGHSTAVHAQLRDGEASERARSIVEALHSVHVVRAEATTRDILATGALKARCVRPDGQPATVVMPRESLPPIDVMRAAIAGAADRSAREILWSMASRGVVAASVLRRLREELAAPAVADGQPSPD